MDLYHLLSWKTAAAAFTVYCVTLVFYRIFLHPLASFPGPKLAAITRWYEAYYDLVREGQYTFKIAELHKTYGPIIRISPHELHVADPAFFEKLYCHDGRWNKYQFACDGFCANGATISTSLHELHQARRSPLNHFFSKARVAARQDVVVRNVDKLCSMISRRVGSTINLGAAASAIAQDVSCEFALGRTYGSLDKDDFNIAVAQTMQNVGFLWRASKHFPWFGLALKSIPPDLVSKVADENAATFFQFLQARRLRFHITKTVKLLTKLQGIDRDTENLLSTAMSSTKDDTTRTIVHEIADSKLPPAEKALPRVLSDVQVIVSAGLETLSGVLRLLLYHVFSNPEILRRLRAELAAVKTDSSGGDAMKLKQLEQLPYLTSVIMEALRLSPAIGTRMARIAPDRDLLYGDWRIPAGTPVGMTAILMHTDETIYPEPLSFNPNRWEHGARKKLEKVFAPFSRGTRICAGMHLAWAELYISLAALVQRFNFEFQDIQASDFQMQRDDFIIGTNARHMLKCHVTLHEA